MPRVLLTGGGSSGHIFPLIAVAEELKKQSAQSGINLEMEFVGDGKFRELINQELAIRFKSTLSIKWRRYFSFLNFVDLLKLPFAFFQVMFHVWWFMPDVIFSKGGYDSFLPSFMSFLFAIPLVVHESDVIPGKANIWEGKWAKKVFISFEGARGYFGKSPKVELSGNPIRRGIADLVDKTSAASAFGLNSQKPIVLITGANQGAQIINEVLLLSIVELTKKFQVIHQCGTKNYDKVNSQILNIVKEGGDAYGKNISDNYRLYPVFDLKQMSLAYSAADVVVARSGAGTIFEVSAVGKPTVLIPLKSSASNHQLANARELEKFGAIVIEESNLSSHILINEIENANEKKESISNSIKKFAKLDSGVIIAQSILSLL